MAGCIALARGGLIGRGLRAGALAGLMVLAPLSALADEVVNALESGLAMDGFDVVAYFDGGPAKGSPDHAVEYKDKLWQFASADHAARFEADPAAYAPQFNGWCSYAVSEEYGAEVDFVNGWAVIDGKLYLNWDEETRDAFVAEQEARVEAAQSNWDGVHAGLKDGSVALYTHAGEGVDIPHPQPLP